MFWVQLMFAKMVLPLLGGAPAVWNTCMVFYQAVLLAGYLYAHLAPKWLGVRRQVIVHLSLLLLAFFTLPVGISVGWTPPATANPILWLLLLLLVSVGLPFFMISTNAPLLQRWFATTGHPAAGDPYFLYAASNLGSVLALLSYPTLVEPLLRLRFQSLAWSWGFVLLALLIAGCAFVLYRATASSAKPVAPEGKGMPSDQLAASNPGRLTVLQRAWWVALSFVPSSLFLGLTCYVTTDIAAVPLLWVIPLAVYLLTFVLVFARRPLVPHRLMVQLEIFLIVPIVILLSYSVIAKKLWIFGLHLGAFFVIAMVCHGELAASRPRTLYLTEFYLWMSVGGVLGGLFNALIAPLLFSSITEYPLVLVLACFLRPPADGPTNKFTQWLDFLIPLGIFLGYFGWLRLYSAGPSKFAIPADIVLVCLIAMLFLRCSSRPLRFGLAVGALLLASGLIHKTKPELLLQERSFFGVHRVSKEGKFHTLHHGTTLHGAQSTEAALRREPLTYFHRKGPMGQIFAAFSGPNAKKAIAVIGLGTGTIAAYGQAGQHITFYEIDPITERIARDPRYFTYLSDSPAQIKVILGDGRLSLKSAPDASFDMIIFDAFSSDAIPVHLITREAISLYLAKLKPDGILIFHISNRFFNLEPMLANLARNVGLVGLYTRQINYDRNKMIVGGQFVVMARNQEDLGGLAQARGWIPLKGQKVAQAWTDDYSDIIRYLKEFPGVRLIGHTQVKKKDQRGGFVFKQPPGWVKAKFPGGAHNRLRFQPPDGKGTIEIFIQTAKQEESTFEQLLEMKKKRMVTFRKNNPKFKVSLKETSFCGHRCVKIEAKKPRSGVQHAYFYLDAGRHISISFQAPTQKDFDRYEKIALKSLCTLKPRNP